MIEVIFEATSVDAVLPTQSHAGDAGYDVYYIGREPLTLAPLDRVLIPLGFKMQIPSGYYCAVCPRSGLALKKGLTVLNAPGIIDSSYRDECGVILINLSNEPVEIKPEDRVAQFVFMPHETIKAWTGSVDTTDRKGGFGSTDKKI